MTGDENGLDFETALEVLCSNECAASDARLLALLRHDVYAHGLNATREGTSVGHASALARAIERFRGLQSSHAAMARPALLADGPHHGVETRHGVDVRPAALRDFARSTLTWARLSWDLSRATGFPDPGDGTAPLARRGSLPLDCRYLATRILSVVDPAAYEAALDADQGGRASAGAVSFWWTERLVDVAVSPDRRAPATKVQVTAFEARLTETVALSRPSEICLDYEPDAFLSEALWEAGLPQHALDGWRGTSTVVDREAGLVLARVGRDGTHVEIASFAADMRAFGRVA